MNISPGVLIVVVLWTLVFVADKVLKRVKRYSRSYQSFLEGLGVSVSFCHIRWYTTNWNRIFLRIGSILPNGFRVWFTLGVAFGGITMVASLIILTLMIYRAAYEPNPEQVLKPVMPGINLPVRHILYYFCTLTIAGVFHEIGHAIAAVREKVRVNGFGLFFMAIYPGAFVDLHPEHLQVISALRQLRVFCAGVWHNFVIVVVAFLTWLLLPYILFPGYLSNKGAVVTHVLQSCPLKNTLLPRDVITSVNDCKIENLQDWLKCIKESVKGPKNGYCGSLLSLPRNDGKTVNISWSNGEPDCCVDSSASRFCFTFMGFKGKMGYSCLPARSTISNPSCRTAKDCPGLLNRVCLKPLTSNVTRLLKIRHTNGNPLIFVGNPWELYFAVGLTPYLPKAAFMSLHLPEYLETFILYLISLSGALALLNIVPCYFLDGQWALHAFIEYFLFRTIPSKNARTILYHIILAFGSCILLTNIIIALWSLGKS